MKEFKGIYCASITPFDEALEVNTAYLKKHIKFLEEKGCQGFLVNGSIGEFPSLRSSERKLILETARNETNKPVMVNVSRFNVSSAIDLTKHAQDVGANALLLMAPLYFQDARMSGIKEYHEKVLSKTSLPVFLYNVPKYSKYELTTEFIRELKAEYSQVIGLKDSTGEMNLINKCLKEFPEMSVFTGSSQLVLDSLKAGAKGGILAIANTFPKKCLEIEDYFLEGKMDKAVQAQQELNQINEIISQYPKISALKRLASFRERLSKPVLVKPPLSNVTEEELKELKSKLAKWM